MLQDFATEDQHPKNSAFEVGDAVVKRGGSLDDNNGSVLSDNSDGSLEDPIVLLGGDDLSASEAEVDDGGPRAERVAADGGLLDSPETTIDSTTPTPLPIPMGGTILMISLRRYSACGLPNKNLRCPIICALVLLPLPVLRASHYTTTLVQQTTIQSAPDLRPRYPILLVRVISPHIIFLRIEA
ncbi:hypothetical protein OCU04_008347 [Sclerotinia nivalis]|uniref:Uncharacterized protein n=1 Tax=Sclerotinia nivalis TaxID=352851 RepID=A0A9X0AHW0_9HELO|nr:hypothetical protein OCU04_008347 [Sclerotinia nivalis]